MNILIPDIWLRSVLRTDASPDDIRTYASLSGPSVERVMQDQGGAVYDVEITSNRTDAMSVTGFARELAAILPRYRIPATLTLDPYALPTEYRRVTTRKIGAIGLKTDQSLSPSFMMAVFRLPETATTPEPMKQALTLAGIRPISPAVDITNYLMRETGQPSHAFDYDRIASSGKKPFMTMRLSKKGDTVTTLDGQTHILHGGDIVIADGGGRIIDLCGIMGGSLSAVTHGTKRIILFIQSYDPVRIRQTSMSLSLRSEASSLFEKGVDPLLAPKAFARAIGLFESLGATLEGSVTDLSAATHKTRKVRLSRSLLDTYAGSAMTDEQISGPLARLGLNPSVTKEHIQVTVPSFRQDIAIAEDIIEEITRIHGYAAIQPKLPAGEVRPAAPDPILTLEDRIRTLLSGWGVHEAITYTMVSKDTVLEYGYGTDSLFRITNPLSSEWEYLRPSLVPGMIRTIRANTGRTEVLKLFEIGHTYLPGNDGLPHEQPTLAIGFFGYPFTHLKGLLEALYTALNVPLTQKAVTDEDVLPSWASSYTLLLGDEGILGIPDARVTGQQNGNDTLVITEINLTALQERQSHERSFVPIPKYPESREDITFDVPARFHIGPFLTAMARIHPWIESVSLIDTYGTRRTLRFVYRAQDHTLTASETQSIRSKIVTAAHDAFGIVPVTVSQEKEQS